MYRRILVPIDLADVDLAKPAVATAVMMARESNGSVRLINVLADDAGDAGGIRAPRFRSATARLRRGSDRDRRQGNRPAAGSKVSAIVQQGGVDREILDEAKEMNADLIVMSSHRTGMRTYFLGSNAGHVVRYATCSVLVVRHQTD